MNDQRTPVLTRGTTRRLTMLLRRDQQPDVLASEEICGYILELRRYPLDAPETVGRFVAHGIRLTKGGERVDPQSLGVPPSGAFGYGEAGAKRRYAATLAKVREYVSASLQ